MLLNDSAAVICDRLLARGEHLRILSDLSPCGTRRVDCGARAVGGPELGLMLAEICLAGLARVSLVDANEAFGDCRAVRVESDHPISACMASQYAGWRVAGENFFAMGSGPMRAAAGREALFDRIGRRERPARVVGVLETRAAPPEAVCRELAAACHVPPERLTLLYAPTASLAGAIQVVARSLESALHKLLELDFDFERIASGWGVAPLPPLAANDMEGIGWTNDAILYGGDVTLCVHGDDASIAEIGPHAVSSASPAHGKPFATIFASAAGDFYRIDPALFSPARLTFQNLDTGRSQRFGQFAPDVLRRSFGLQSPE